MNVFFDTSSLFKLYHKESGTEELMDFFNNNQIDSLFLAEITQIEFSSAVWKKCRKGDIDEQTGIKLIEKFKIDSKTYSFVKDSVELKFLAVELIAKYWEKGLRTLDSIQLASGLMMKPDIKYYFTSDNLLAEIATMEELETR